MRRTLVLEIADDLFHFVIPLRFLMPDSESYRPLYASDLFTLYMGQKYFPPERPPVQVAVSQDHFQGRPLVLLCFPGNIEPSARWSVQFK